MYTGWKHTARIAVMAAAAVLASCSNPTSGSVNTAPLPPESAQSPTPDIVVRAGLPPLDALPRSVSSAARQMGQEAVETMFCTVGPDEGLLLLPPTPKSPEDPEPEGSLTWAIYVFDGLAESPPAVVSKTGSNSQSQIWLALADWNARQWRFAPWFFFTDPGVILEEMGNPGRFLDEDGRLAVAFVIEDCPAQVLLRYVEVAVPPVVTEIQASTDRWDGVRVTWQHVDTSDGYHVYRRPAGTQHDWVQLTDSPLGRYANMHHDPTVESLRLYEYRVSTAMYYQVRGQLHLLWNYGASAVGYRRLIELDIDDSVLVAEPANLRNFLSYFYLTEERSDEPSLARATTYPPGEGWSLGHSGDDNFGLFELPADSGFDKPSFAHIQAQEVNNPMVTVGYANADGCFVQVAPIEMDGKLNWEAPIRLRDAQGLHFLGFSRYASLMMAFMWNETSGMVECMLSSDHAGRTWFEFQPGGWMQPTSRRPSGVFRADFAAVEVFMTYVEAETDQAVVIRHVGDVGWQDVSPGITVRGLPQRRNCKLGILETAMGLFHIPTDGSQVGYLLFRDNEWRPDESPVAAESVGGGITEFDMYAPDSPAGNANTYLAWAEDGNVWFSFTSDASYQEWEAPILVDGSGACRNIRVLFVGTDPSFETNFIFVSYLREQPDGGQRLYYQDMKSLRLDP